MAQLSIRMDDALKARADVLFNDLGLNMSTAVNMFVKQAVRQGGIPFEITTKTDPFYSAANQARVIEGTKQPENG
ncbi:MAG: type II toxin-antitoxin system RelB/DinJ family antitoxin [Firmicutes bacterium]|nr:type II toxin-antitoxin system RelB/DinJ family antitoxin [Bacillota bacterium]